MDFDAAKTSWERARVYRPVSMLSCLLENEASRPPVF